MDLWKKDRDPKQASTLLERITSEDPEYVMAQLALGEMALARKLYQQAKLRFENALALEPKKTHPRLRDDIFARVHHLLGCSLMESMARGTPAAGTPQDGPCNHFQKALQINPRFAVVHRDLATWYDRRGEFQSALAHSYIYLRLAGDEVTAEEREHLAAIKRRWYSRRREGKPSLIKKG